MNREEQSMTQETGTFFRMRDIVKKYPMGDEEAVVLRNVNLEIREGEYLSVLGPSGSGKSTLMNIIGCLDKASSGEYMLHGRLIDALSEAELAEIRGQEIGFIFQNSQLLPKLDALKNVELPLLYVAIARALVTDPSLLLADEPTGALDQTTGQQIMNLFKELHQDGRTIIMITHDLHVARNASRTVHIIDGRLSEGEVTAQ